MSFSSDIKRELCSVRELSEKQLSALLYGMFYAGKTLEKKPVIRTELFEVFTLAKTLCGRVFPNEKIKLTKLVNSGGAQYTVGLHSRGVVARFGDFSHVAPEIVSGNDEIAGAFLRGIFVSCGSVTDPEKEYHLEIRLPENDRTEPLCEFIREHGFPIKQTIRSKSEILYFKTSEAIEDFLTYIGAGLRALEIMQVKIEKDIRNRANRVVNCDNANLDKTVAASEKSRRDIELVLAALGSDKLSPELRETATLRLQNPESSLSELCALHEKPISRSGLNHRLKKLAKMAEDIRNSEDKIEA